MHSSFVELNDQHKSELNSVLLVQIHFNDLLLFEPSKICQMQINVVIGFTVYIDDSVPKYKSYLGIQNNNSKLPGFW